MSSPRVIISGGGTGGHIFPAIAIANALKEKNRNTEILFIGAKGRMEMEKVPAAGYNIEGLWISGLQRSLTLKNLSFPIKLISSLIRARKILKSFKPDVAVGVGGYASGPMLRVATSHGIPALIQEQNSYPGITNKMLGGRVDKICVAYDGMERFFPREKIILTGNPVRKEVVQLDGKKQAAMDFFGLKDDRPILLVIGGSLGARSINRALKKHLKLFAEKNYQVIWQTGKGFIAEAKEAVSEYEGSGIKAYDFINRMDYAYSVADLAVSRAGAIAVSELCLVRKPAILVPLPHAAEDHQTKNAMALVNHKAAELMNDQLAEEELGNAVVRLMEDEEQRERLSINIASLGFDNAADVIANEVMKLVKK